MKLQHQYAFKTVKPLILAEKMIFMWSEQGVGNIATNRGESIIWRLTHVDMVIGMDTLAPNGDANNLTSTISNNLNKSSYKIRNSG